MSFGATFGTLSCGFLVERFEFAGALDILAIALFVLSGVFALYASPFSSSSGTPPRSDEEILMHSINRGNLDTSNQEYGRATLVEENKLINTSNERDSLTRVSS